MSPELRSSLVIPAERGSEMGRDRNVHAVWLCRALPIPDWPSAVRDHAGNERDRA